MAGDEAGRKQGGERRVLRSAFSEHRKPAAGKERRKASIGGGVR